MKNIIIFTDGAVPNNQKKGTRKGGVGVFFGIDDPRNISYSMIESSSNKVTNQVCELTVCIMAIETLLTTQKIKNNIELYTDSMYIVNSINTWAKNWEKNNWKKSTNEPILNLTLIKKLYYLSKNVPIKFIHIKAHTKPPSNESPEYYLWFGNYMADKLAVNATK